MKKRKCYLCQREENFPAKNRADQVELRPYGPRGEDVCFQCAMSTPERQEETNRSYANQLESCGLVAIIGQDCGPYPLEHLATDEVKQ